MPIYEYQCSHCRYYLEVMQKITDAKLRKCPSCGRNTLQKLMSAPVFRLKGSGWYETDFKSDQEQKRNLAGAEKEPPAADAKDSKDGGKDAKEAAATEGAATEGAAKEGAAKEGAATEGSAKESKDAKQNPKDGKDGKDASAKPAADRSKPRASKGAARGKAATRHPVRNAGRAGRGKPSRGRR
jgi:putative FmdB family regulatory protein